MQTFVLAISLAMNLILIIILGILWKNYREIKKQYHIALYEICDFTEKVAANFQYAFEYEPLAKLIIQNLSEILKTILLNDKFIKKQLKNKPEL